MKIRFLGTSFGAPSVGRHQQSMLLETNSGDAYLVDAGAPVLDILVDDGYDLTRIKAVFITHLHGDHMNGLVDMLNLTEFYQMRYTVFLSEQRGIDLFEAFLEMQQCCKKSDRVSYQLIRVGHFYDDGVLKVKSVCTAHMEDMQKPSYGFLLEADGGSIYVSGDLHPSLKDFPTFLHDEFVDMVVTECAHFTAEELYQTLRTCKTDRVAVTHVMPPEKYHDLKVRANDMPMNIVFPNDGDEYKIKERLK